MQLLAVDLALDELVEGHGQIDVADEPHHLDVVADVVLVGRQVLPQLGRELVEDRVDAVDAAPLVDQLRRRLLPHPRHTRQVVGIVTPQGRVLHVVGGHHTGPFLDAGLVVEDVVGHPPLVVEDLDVGVLDQLVAVAVAGHDDDVVAPVAGLRGQRGDDVVGLVAGGLEHRHGEGLEHLSDQPHLLAEDVGCRLALRLVGRRHLVAERGFGPVERDRDQVGVVVLHQVDEHRGEPEHGVGDLPRCGRHVGREGEEGPVGEGVPVDEHHVGHCGRP